MASGSPDRAAAGNDCRAATRTASASASSSTPIRAAIRWAATAGADRVELYTEPFARAFERGELDAQRRFRRLLSSRELAHALGLGVNAGHDLDLDNLVLFRRLPHLDEVSIGHAIVSRALFVGLRHVVAEYRQLLASGMIGLPT